MLTVLLSALPSTPCPPAGAVLTSFTVANEKAAASWYKAKSFAYDSGYGLNWFSYYGMTKERLSF